MAGWRQAIELALSEEDVTRLSAVARSRAEPASRVERARYCSPTGKTSRFLRWRRLSGCTIRLSSIASNGPWLMVRGGARLSAEAGKKPIAPAGTAYGLVAARRMAQPGARAAVARNNNDGGACATCSHCGSTWCSTI